jgi:DNA (cytosine-5)-methyltransferase 1
MSDGRWPTAAFGQRGQRWVFSASLWPIRHEYKHLLDLLDPRGLKPLSHRATLGFLNRARRSKLRFERPFLEDLQSHLKVSTERGEEAA